MDESKLRQLFPNGSDEFFKVNFGLRTRVVKQDVRTTVVHSAPREAKSHERISVGIVLYRVRLLDKENAYGATKPLTDCLCKVGLIPDDSTEDIDLTVTQQKVQKRIDQHTEVRIDYP